MGILKKIAILSLCTIASATVSHADEVTDALEYALDAYNAGDIKTAKEEVDFALQLLSQLKAAGLGDFLPDALDGWEKTVGETQSVPGIGGQMASASYTRDQDRIDIEMMADSQVVTAMGAMFGNAALMGSMGQVKRINRQRVVVTNEGEIQAMVDNRVMIIVKGRASLEDKEAYFAAIDVRELEEF